MKYLSKIEDKINSNSPLTREDLIFLYEIDLKIKGFGHGDDPRVTELIKARNPKKDAPIIFDCTPNEIAWGQSELNENTKAYIGPLFKGILTQLSHLGYLYTSFPGYPIRKSELEIGGQSVQELNNLMREKNIQVYSGTQDMLNSSDFTTQDNPENIELISLKVQDLGFIDLPTTDQLHTRAAELGLNLCPAEVGPHQWLKDLEQPIESWYRIAMKPISDSKGNQLIFALGRNEFGLWLHDHWAPPDRRWNLDHVFVFLLRKLS